MTQELNQEYGIGHLWKEGKRLASFRYDVLRNSVLLTAQPGREADCAHYANRNLMLELQDGQWIKLHDSCRGGLFQYEVSNRN